MLIKPGARRLAWFLKIDTVWIVSMCVCVYPPPRLLIGASLSEPHTSRSRCERRTCVASTKIYDANTESPTLGGHHTSVVRASQARKFTMRTRKAPHWVVIIRASYVRRMHENLLYEHGKPHTGWSSYERRTSVSCTKILDKKTESPHLRIYGCIYGGQL